MKKICLLLLLFCAFVSCDKTYHKFDKSFVDFKWPKDDYRLFEFAIPEDGLYDITFELSHGFTYPFSDLPLNLVIISPNGKQETFKVNIPISKDGKKIGECALDICDLNFNIKSGIILTKGAYKIVISNAFSASYVPDIIGIGLTVKHSAH